VSYTDFVPASDEPRRFAAESESHLLSMDVALTAHRIPHTVHREHTESIAGCSLYVAVSAIDAERASPVVRDVQHTPLPGAAWDQRRFRTFAIVATIVVLGGALLVRYLSRS
jgi:hypothetical protein